jgi:ferredoxin
MALKITSECINCDVCEPVCPNNAIFMGQKIFQINPDLCTECVGHFDIPQCVEICPIDCIPKDETITEYKTDLYLKLVKIKKINGMRSLNENFTYDVKS